MEFPSSQGITVHHTPYPFIAASKFHNSLARKVVLITGASRGIGRATALGFASAGASVAVLARSTASLTSLVEEITTKFGTPVLAITGDVLKDAVGVVKRVEEKLGPIDILVNNAATSRMRRFTEESTSDLDSWWKVFEVNVKAPIALIHAVLPSFLAKKKGIVITVGSSVVEIQAPFFPSYSASKAAITKALQLLDIELRPLGILNFIVHPGMVKTDLSLAENSSASLIIGDEMRGIQSSYVDYMIDEPELAAQTFVALAVLASEGDEKVKTLSGRYFDVEDDLEEVLNKYEEIEKRDLYKLGLKKL
jgi:NAD(P)-dependent dehydrogenase (short-subunit alcohol dehydrogenase family)